MAWTCQMLSHQGTENVSQQISCNAHCREVWLRVVYCFDRRCCSLSRRTADGLARWALGCMSREDQVGVRGGGESWLNRERLFVCCVKCLLLLLLYAVFRGLSLSLSQTRPMGIPEASHRCAGGEGWLREPGRLRACLSGSVHVVRPDLSGFWELWILLCSFCALLQQQSKWLGRGVLTTRRLWNGRRVKDGRKRRGHSEFCL